MVVTDQQHFFSEAPVLRWIDWVWRQVWPIKKETPPSRVVLDDFSAQSIKLPIGIQIKRMRPDRSTLYAGFLGAQYSSKTDSYSLIIPIEKLTQWLTDGFIVGVEATDLDGHLVGIVCSSYAGLYLSVEHSVITWFCIHPLWRGRGVANALLRSMVKETPNRKVHWWRTDGLLQSPIPSIYTQQRITRPRRQMRSEIGTGSLRVEQQPLRTWRNKIIASWTQQHPTGLVLDSDHAFTTSTSTEVWVMRSPGLTLALVVQPTFERHKTTGLPWCEIVWWVVEGIPRTQSQASSREYTLGLYCEAMLDTLPYGWFEAPASMPHLDAGWVSTRQQNWSVLGLDPGTPVQRPILSLLAL